MSCISRSLLFISLVVSIPALAAEGEGEGGGSKKEKEKNRRPLSIRRR